MVCSCYCQPCSPSHVAAVNPDPAIQEDRRLSNIPVLQPLTPFAVLRSSFLVGKERGRSRPLQAAASSYSSSYSYSKGRAECGAEILGSSFFVLGWKGARTLSSASGASVERDSGLVLLLVLLLLLVLERACGVWRGASGFLVLGSSFFVLGWKGSWTPSSASGGLVLVDSLLSPLGLPAAVCLASLGSRPPTRKLVRRVSRSFWVR